MIDLAGKLIPQLLENTAERLPERVALMVNNGDGTLYTLTYSQFQSRVKKLSSFIQKAGFASGEHIAVLGKNSPDWAIAYLAVQTAGCIVIPLDAAMRPQELRHIIRHSDAKAIFMDSKFMYVIKEGDEEFLPDLTYFQLDNIESLIKTEDEPLHPRYSDDDNITAAIIYTSGTTGSPKGVVLSHKNIIADIIGMMPIIPFTEKDNFLSVLPIHHAFENTCGFLTPIAIGCGICYARALRAKEILEDIAASNATVMLGVPLLFDKFYKGILKGVKKKGAAAKTVFGTIIGITKALDGIFKGHSGKVLMRAFRKKAGFGNMWLMISGGAAIRPEVVHFFNHFGIICIQGYGLSETSPVLAVNPPFKNKAASVGPPVAGIDIRIGNRNEDEVGEIQAIGASVFQKYYKNPEATDEAFTEDGWFKTGDLGFIDTDGYVTICGREKNLIVTGGGKNVYPEEIEDVLNSTQFILESIVIGMESGSGEEPFAIIVPDFDAVDAHFEGNWSNEKIERLLKQTIEDVNKKIALYKRIKGFKIQEDEFPKTSTKKIKRYIFSGKEIQVGS